MLQASSFIRDHNPRRKVLVFPFYGWENWSSERWIGQSHQGLEPRTAGLQSPRLPAACPTISRNLSLVIYQLVSASHLLPLPYEPHASLFLFSSRQSFMPFAPPALRKCGAIIPLQKCTGFPQAACQEHSCLLSPLWFKTLKDPMKGQKSDKVKRRCSLELRQT